MVEELLGSGRFLGDGSLKSVVETVHTFEFGDLPTVHFFFDLTQIQLTSLTDPLLADADPRVQSHIPLAIQYIHTYDFLSSAVPPWLQTLQLFHLEIIR